MHGSLVHPRYFSLVEREIGPAGAMRRPAGGGGGVSEGSPKSAPRPDEALDDDTNPLFISAVRIFLDFVRDKQGILCPEKTCNLDDLIRFLADFQDEARTKKGEKYSPSTIRVIRYSLNRVIALGRNRQEMRPYPTQNTGLRKKRKLEEETNRPDDQEESGPASRRHTLSNSAGAASSLRMRERSGTFPDPSADQFAGPAYNLTKKIGRQALSTDSSIKPVHHGVDVFRNWLSDQGISPFFETFHEEQINDQLVSFVRCCKTELGKEHGRNSIQAFRVAITHFLKQHSGIDISRDVVFEPTREEFRRALQSYLPEKKPLTEGLSSFSGTEWLGIPVECIKDLYRSGALSVSTAINLQKKVWLELTIFFRDIPCCPDQTFWNKNTFKISSGDHGVKYVELNPDMYNRYACAIDRTSQQSSRIMVQRTSSPYCPVASFELYLQALDPLCDSLFVQPLGPTMDTKAEYYRSGPSPDLIRYSKEPLTSVHLSAMMETIAQAAKLPFHFTCLSAAETDHVAWMRALTALELELQCQALQFTFPVGGATQSPLRSVAPSSPESVNCQRTSVIQAAPRMQIGEIQAVQHAPIRSPDFIKSPSMCDTPAPHRPRTSSANHRVHDNMSPEAIDLVWRKKMKLDHCSITSTAQPKDRTGTDATIQSHTSVISHDEDEFAVQKRGLEGATSLQEEVIPSSNSVTSLTTCKDVVREETSSHDTVMSGEDGSLTTEEIKFLYASGVFDPDAADTLQSKILFELSLHFARIVPFPKKTKLWNWAFFQVLCKPDSQKCIDLGVASTEAKNSRIYERAKSSKHCPLAAFEKYSSLLPPSSRMLFPKIRRGAATPKEWYCPEPCDIQDVDAYLAHITKAAKFPKTITQELLNDVALKNWSDALDQLENSNILKRPDDASGPSGEKCINSNNRPTVKRILELYRMSKSDSKNEDVTEVTPVVKHLVGHSNYNCGLLKSEKRIFQEVSTSEELPKQNPVIVVKPQISILRNEDTALLDRAELKQMILEALAKALASPEWETQIEEAITSAQGGVQKSKKDVGCGTEVLNASVSNLTSDDSQKKKLSTPTENQKTVTCIKGNFSIGQQSTSHTRRRSMKELDRELDDAASSSSISSEEYVLRIADVSDEAEHGTGIILSEKGEDISVASDEAHGSQRRKAFFPIRHSD